MAYPRQLFSDEVKTSGGTINLSLDGEGALVLQFTNPDDAKSINNHEPSTTIKIKKDNIHLLLTYCRTQKSNISYANDLISATEKIQKLSLTSTLSPAVDDEWKCSACTYMNSSVSTNCYLCDVEKPTSPSAESTPREAKSTPRFRSIKSFSVDKFLTPDEIKNPIRLEITIAKLEENAHRNIPMLQIKILKPIEDSKRQYLKHQIIEAAKTYQNSSTSLNILSLPDSQSIRFLNFPSIVVALQILSERRYISLAKASYKTYIEDPLSKTLTPDEINQAKCLLCPEQVVEEFKFSVPSYLISTFSQEIMNTPYILTSSGQSYDMLGLYNWLVIKENNTCPITRTISEFKQAIPNRALKKYIERYVKCKGVLPPVTADNYPELICPHSKKLMNKPAVALRDIKLGSITVKRGDAFDLSPEEKAKIPTGPDGSPLINNVHYVRDFALNGIIEAIKPASRPEEEVKRPIMAEQKAAPIAPGGPPGLTRTPMGRRPSESGTKTPRASDNQWSCSACTFINDAGSTACNICSTTKAEVKTSATRSTTVPSPTTASSPTPVPPSLPADSDRTTPLLPFPQEGKLGDPRPLLTSPVTPLTRLQQPPALTLTPLTTKPWYKHRWFWSIATLAVAGVLSMFLPLTWLGVPWYIWAGGVITVGAITGNYTCKDDKNNRGNEYQRLSATTPLYFHRREPNNANGQRHEEANDQMTPPPSSAPHTPLPPLGSRPRDEEPPGAPSKRRNSRGSS
jgi:hypothetical protein